jgi:hypothetical protein
MFETGPRYHHSRNIGLWEDVAADQCGESTSDLNLRLALWI